MTAQLFSLSTQRIVRSLKRLERAMDANAEMTDALIERGELLDQLSAAMARDYAVAIKADSKVVELKVRRD